MRCVVLRKCPSLMFKMQYTKFLSLILHAESSLAQSVAARRGEPCDLDEGASTSI